MWIAYRFLPLKGFISKYTLSAEKPHDLYYSLLLPVFLLIKDSQILGRNLVEEQRGENYG